MSYDVIYQLVDALRSLFQRREMKLHCGIFEIVLLLLLLLRCLALCVKLLLLSISSTSYTYYSK